MSLGQSEDASKLLYENICAKILSLKVLLSGNELMETIESLIETNQQVTLDLNEADQDTAQGVEIEETLDALANEIEERQESNGFLTDEDISENQTKVVELVQKIVA